MIASYTVLYTSPWEIFRVASMQIGAYRKHLQLYCTSMTICKKNTHTCCQILVVKWNEQEKQSLTLQVKFDCDTK